MLLENDLISPICRRNATVLIDHFRTLAVCHAVEAQGKGAKRAKGAADSDIDEAVTDETERILTKSKSKRSDYQPVEKRLRKVNIPEIAAGMSDEQRYEILKDRGQFNTCDKGIRTKLANDVNAYPILNITNIENIEILNVRRI